MILKFEKVGHSVYILNGEMCLGRIKKRYNDKLYFELLERDYPISKEELSEIVQEMDNDPR